MYKFIKTTVIGGLLFILPLVLIVVLIEKAIHLLRGPVEKLLPMFKGYDVAGVTLVSVATLLGLIVCVFSPGCSRAPQRRRGPWKPPRTNC